MPRRDRKIWRFLMSGSSTPCIRPQKIQATPETIWQKVRMGRLPQLSMTRMQKT